MALGHGENKYEKYGKPTLDLQFSGPKGSISNRADSGAISVEFTRTQDTQASYYKSDGIIGYASTDVARFDHDPVTGESLGLLIEQGRTNILINSDLRSPVSTTNISLADFGFDPANTVDPSGLPTTSAPDGGLASKLVFANGYTRNAGDNTYLTGFFYSHGSNDGIISVFVKPAEWTGFEVRYGNQSSNRYFRYFDLTGAGNCSNSDCTITLISNGWYRITLPNNNQNRLSFIPSTSYQSSSTGDGTSGIYIWGAQLEVGSFATSYIPTSGSTSTRGVDTASITGAGFSSFYNSSSEGSMFIDIKRPTFASSGAYLSFHNRSGYFLQDISTNFILRIAGENSVTLGAYATTTDYKIASSYLSATEFNTSVNGSTPVSTSTSINFTNATELHIGRGNNAVTSHYRNGPSNCHIRRLTFWPTRLSDSDLQSLTE